MDRREMFRGAASGLILAAAGNTVFAAGNAKQPAGGQQTHPSGSKYQSLIDSAADCVKKGQACVSHGLVMLSQAENKEMAICAMRVSDMIAACVAIEQLASYSSPHLAATAKVTMAIGQDCEKECRKFEKEIPTCKQMADSCVSCLSECKKITA